MNCQREGKAYCYFHPKEVIVGICALCLNERLLVLASKQGHLPLPKGTRKSFRNSNNVFAFGSLFQRFEFRHQKPDNDSGDDSGASLEDSFISIKFEDNGIALWDDKRECNLKPIKEPGKEGNGDKGLAEHTKPLRTLKWHKRIGHLLQLLARWKTPKKSSVHHISSATKVERKKGWIRRLTRRTTTSTSTSTSTINGK